jgi:hypothetical protein
MTSVAYGGRRRLWLYRVNDTGSSPGSGTFTIFYDDANPSETPQEMQWAVVEWAGTNLTTPFGTAATEAQAGGTEVSPTATGTVDTGDATFGCMGGEVNDTVTTEAGWTDLVNAITANGIRRFVCSWDDAADLTPSWTWSGTNSAGGIAVLVKAGGAPATDADAEAATGTGTANDATVETVAGQSLAPATDITTTGWTATGGTGSLASAIDESPANDADFVTSPANPSSSVLEVQFEAADDPGVSSGHQVDYRLRVLNAGSYSVTAALFQGGTQIATETRTTGLTSSFQTFTLTLSGGEADAITDYADLRLRVTATAAA